MSLFATNAADSIDSALRDVNVAAPSTTKFLELERVLARELGLDPSQISAVTISKAGNTRVRAAQSPKGRSASVLVCVVPSDDEVAATRRACIKLVTEGQFVIAAVVNRNDSDGWAARWAVVAEGDDTVSFVQALERAGAEVELHVAQSTRTAGETVRPENLPDLAQTISPTPLQLDGRTRRMVRTAVATHPAVMLVGPPGTGKTQLVSELIDEVAAEPSAFGMSVAPSHMAVTLDESWTTRELVGGETVDDRSRLRFSPGYVLQAIAQDRWLILDEANRADLDRIFGGLLTWLSGQPVTIGRVSSHPEAGPVRLGWNTGPQSQVVGEEQLTADEPSGEPVDYLAGTEWRMLGTYNALDAQRVFRFGLALGRRFAHVPIPAPDKAAFRSAVNPRLATVPERLRDMVSDALTDLYDAHLSVGGATLGPAMFLGMPSYLAAGLAANPATPMSELLAEAYLTGVGAWLARLDDDQLDLLQHSIGENGPLGVDQWDWVRGQLPALR